MLPFVSVLTPTYNRRKFIPAAITCFKNQTYPQDKMEWIVLDDGQDKVKDLFDAAGLKNVRYVALPDGQKLKIGAKRNQLNELAKGEICVCFDDDDYYPPERVRKAVAKLRSAPCHKIPLVGSSQLYLYFTDRDEIWSIGPYAQNHCTNGTMAYWHSYTKDHKYDETVDMAEEKSFTNSFSTPVLQLYPEDTMLVICHAHNTFDKRNLIKQKNPLLKQVKIKMRQLVKDKSLRDFYLALAADYKEKDEAAAALAAETGAVTRVAESVATATPESVATAAATPEPVAAAAAAATAEPVAEPITDN